MRSSNPPMVRVLCGNCRKKLTDFDSEPLETGGASMTRMTGGGIVTAGMLRARHNGGAYYPCGRCGARHPVRLDRMRRAYWKALRGRTERRNVIVIPQDL
jgi:hypothetical protein